MERNKKVNVLLFIAAVVLILINPTACGKYQTPPEYVGYYDAGSKSVWANIAYSADGSFLSAVSHERGMDIEAASLVLWDLRMDPTAAGPVGGEPVGGIGEQIRDERFIAVGYSPDFSTVITGNWNNELCIWSAADGKLNYLFEDHSALIKGIVYSPDGKFAVSIDMDENLIVRRTDDYVILWQVKDESQLESLAISPDSRTLLTGGQGRDVIVRDITSGEVLRRYESGQFTVSGIDFIDGGKILVTYMFYTDKILNIKLWDYPSGEPIHELEYKSKHMITGLDFHPQEPVAVIVGRDRDLLLYDLNNGKILKKIELQSTYNYDVCFSPDGKYFALGENSTVEIYRYDIDKLPE